MAANVPGGDPDGLRWIASELRHQLPDVWRHRRSLPWSVYRTWRRLGRTTVPYTGPSAGAPASLRALATGALQGRPSAGTPRLTIGITTRNRPEALARCVRSLALLAPLAPRVIVFDDASSEPAAQAIATAVPAGLDLTVIRDEGSVGNIAGRNRLMREAATPYVLLLDDDAVILSPEPIDRALRVLDGDERIAALAFAQAEADGRPWPERMQPGPGQEPKYVAAYIGFAHLLRRDLFLALGGYREQFVFYGEEKDYCVRLLHAGYRTVYLPAALVGHIPDPGGRVEARYVRYAVRNDFLYSLYNEPWPLVAVGVPVRLWRYRRMAAGISGGDTGGLGWILGELRHALPSLGRHRKPVSWATVRMWRQMSRGECPYPAGLVA
jgi:GT2 family glycosyltransferase